MPSQALTSSSSTTSSTLATATVFVAGVASGVALYAARERHARKQAVSSKKLLDPKSASSMREPAAELVDLIVRYHEKLHTRQLDDPSKTYAIFLIHSVVDGVHILRLAVGGLEIDEWNIDNAVQVLSESLTHVISSTPKWEQAYQAFLDTTTA
ncbi:hypothetical protein P43SY_003515 [Pythium insidiosum]|uniref:Uncharacterized protein n=1 Tax=Pythium insidiosum TaxID=114742 RepID=A0AAD5Q626_PYTIN|nr:hypothetical protein P43SY_003515 [Pythium insidiosum]